MTAPRSSPSTTYPTGGLPADRIEDGANDFVEEREDERYRFAKVSAAVLDDTNISANAKLLYCVGRRFVGKDRLPVYPSYQTLADRCGFSRGTAIKAARELHDYGLILIQYRERSEGHQQPTNLIRFADPLRFYGLLKQPSPAGGSPADELPQLPRRTTPSSADELPLVQQTNYGSSADEPEVSVSEGATLLKEPQKEGERAPLPLSAGELLHSLHGHLLIDFGCHAGKPWQDLHELVQAQIALGRSVTVQTFAEAEALARERIAAKGRKTSQRQYPKPWDLRDALRDVLTPDVAAPEAPKPDAETKPLTEEQKAELVALGYAPIGSLAPSP